MAILNQNNVPGVLTGVSMGVRACVCAGPCEKNIQQKHGVDMANFLSKFSIDASLVQW